MTERLARACAAHPWRAIVAWIVALVLAAAAAALVMGDLTTEGHPTNHPESERAADAIGRAFPVRTPNAIVTDVVVLRSGRYAVDQPAYRAYVDRALRDLRATGVVGGAQNYYSTRDPALVSPDHHALLVPIFVTDTDSAGKAVDAVKSLDGDPAFSAKITGDQRSTTIPMRSRERPEARGAAIRRPGGAGRPPARLRRVVAGLIPLLIAIMSIVVAIGLVALFSQAFELSTYYLNMLTGMGLALGIDYSLFIVFGYRRTTQRT